jgi:hypothetical protein
MVFLKKNPEPYDSEPIEAIKFEDTAECLAAIHALGVPKVFLNHSIPILPQLRLSMEPSALTAELGDYVVKTHRGNILIYPAAYMHEYYIPERPVKI